MIGADKDGPIEETRSPRSALKLRLLVVKVASRCNLNCSYCFMYNLGDATWRNQPKVMPPEVVEALMARVRSHCERHRLERFVFVMHGGEPLLAGAEFLEDFVTRARRALLPAVQPIFTIQTNGTLLSPAVIEQLRRLDVQLGISLDGPAEIHDRHRKDHAGRGSYAAVSAGIECARQGEGYPFRLISVIDLSADPVACYEHAKSLGAYQIDFLFPDATHDHRPPGYPGSETPYADWMIRIFDRWFLEKPRVIAIRLLEEIIRTLVGGVNMLDIVGTGRNEVMVVETNGGLEAVDSLKVCGDSFTKTAANVLTHELDEALSTDLAQAYHLSGERACATCRSCSLHPVCGGGYLPHRHSRARGFDNTSVYCSDLMKLITHVQAALYRHLPGSLRDRLTLAPVSYQEVRARGTATTTRRTSLPVFSRVR
jgi:uncharacterized protein